MLFDSLSFLIFFPVVTVLYYVCPQRWRWLLLLIASCYFYMAFIPKYIVVLFFLICVDYTVGRLLEGAKGRNRRYIFIVSIISNIGALFVFKYYNFFTVNTSYLAHVLHWNYSPILLSLALPIGLSFHTFQSLSYIIEVYAKRQKAEKHFGIYALYVMFYPQLVAGPIERPQQMLPQLHKEHFFHDSRVKDGLRRILFGLFKKVVIADRLAIIVNVVYADPYQYLGLPLVFATVAFAFQIYCDFSGYTDIAIGSAQVMGIKLVENFNYPYLSRSIRDFWRRWNMSLYSWFRDYIYIPLGGNRVPPLRNYLNILIVFFLTGLWHGASWTFVVWGLINGAYMVINIAFDTYISSLKGVKKLTLTRIRFPLIVLQTAFTFGLACIAWVFFRANTLADAFYIITHSVTGVGNFIRSLLTFNFKNIEVYLFHQGRGLGIDFPQFVIIVAAFILLGVMEYLERKMLLYKVSFWLRWGLIFIIVFMVINFQASYKIPFIYFQF